MTYQLRDGRIIDESNPKYLQYKELRIKKYSIEKIAQELDISEGEVADFILMHSYILRQRTLEQIKGCLDKGYSIKEIRAVTGYTTKRIKDYISIIEDGEKNRTGTRYI